MQLAIPYLAGKWLAHVPSDRLWQVVSRHTQLAEARALNSILQCRPPGTSGLLLLLHAQLYHTPAVTKILEGLSPVGRTQLLYEARKLPQGEEGVAEVVQRLREAGAHDVARSLLLDALKNKDVIVLQQLLQDGVNIDDVFGNLLATHKWCRYWLWAGQTCTPATT